MYKHDTHGKHQCKEVGEIQSTLNQKNGSKPFRAVDFASRFIMIIENMNFKLRHYKSTNLNVKSTILKDFESIF
jgi:hypothetical protein